MLDLFFRVLMGLAVIGVGVLGGYGALAFAWTDLQAWWAYGASRRWAPAAGRVTDSKIVAIRSSRAVRYQPEVHYAYTAAGQAHTGRRLTFTSWTEWLTKEEAERALAAYAPGAAVTVLHDPQHPQEAVLERRAPRGPLVSCFVVVLLAGTSLMCLATGLRGLILGP